MEINKHNNIKKLCHVLLKHFWWVILYLFNLLLKDLLQNFIFGIPGKKILYNNFLMNTVFKFIQL